MDQPLDLHYLILVPSMSYPGCWGWMSATQWQAALLWPWHHGGGDDYVVMWKCWMKWTPGAAWHHGLSKHFTPNSQAAKWCRINFGRGVAQLEVLHWWHLKSAATLKPSGGSTPVEVLMSTSSVVNVSVVHDVTWHVQPAETPGTAQSFRVAHLGWVHQAGNIVTPLKKVQLSNVQTLTANWFWCV